MNGFCDRNAQIVKRQRAVHGWVSAPNAVSFQERLITAVRLEGHPHRDIEQWITEYRVLPVDDRANAVLVDEDVVTSEIGMKKVGNRIFIDGTPLEQSMNFARFDWRD